MVAAFGLFTAGFVAVAVVLGTGSGGAGAAIGPIIGVVLLGGAAGYLVWSSRTGVDRLLDGLVTDLALQGKERILDVGCGQGRLLLKLAAAAPGAKIEAVDVFLRRARTGNTLDAASANIEAAGIADRVTVREHDLTDLPFRDGSFEVVVSSLALHNLPLAKDRGKAMQEMIRVAKPGGTVVVLDIGKAFEYAAWLEDAGFLDLDKSAPKFTTYPPSRIVRGRKPTSGSGGKRAKR